MNNLEWVRSASPSDLKNWYCDGRFCGSCPHGGVVCGFNSWLYSESQEEKRSAPWEEEPVESLNLPPRLMKILLRYNIHTLGRLYEIRLFDLKRCPGISDVLAGAIAKAFYTYTGEKLKK